MSTTAATSVRCWPRPSPPHPAACATSGPSPSASAPRAPASRSRSPAESPSTPPPSCWPPASRRRWRCPHSTRWPATRGSSPTRGRRGRSTDIEDGETIAILGTSLTAIDVAGSILTRHPHARVVALSRNGDLPRRHEDPWRARFAEPAFTVDEFRAWDDPLEQAVTRIRGFGEDWRRALDSIRPISQDLWIGMDEPLRRSFVDRYRHVFDIHRHRVAAEIARDLDAWIRDGRLSVRAASVERVDRTPDDGLRIVARPGAGSSTAGPWEVDRIVVAVGPNTDPAANPLLGAAIGDGLMRPGPLGISIDSDPVTCRLLDANGAARLPGYAIGALRRGVLWDTLAIPEIREQSVTIARQLLPA